MQVVALVIPVFSVVLFYRRDPCILCILQAILIQYASGDSFAVKGEPNMKKRIILAAVAMSCFVIAANGCGKADTAKETTAAATEAATGETEAEKESEAEKTEETEEQMANPWVESDKDGVLAATGIELNVPEDATEILYTYLADENLAQVSYSTPGNKWVYRGKMADAFEDISGMFFEWDTQEEVDVAGRPAIFYDFNSDQENVWMINWYDGVPGIMYSLSVTADSIDDLDGLDMQGVAESVFVPMQDEVDGDEGKTE